jgi:hypothetical protein
MVLCSETDMVGYVKQWHGEKGWAYHFVSCHGLWGGIHRAVRSVVIHSVVFGINRSRV